MNRRDAGRSGLDRYREIVLEWDAFVDACARPIPPVVRANTLRCDPDDLIARLAVFGIEAEPFPWAPTVLRLSRPASRTLEHWLGWFYIQEATQAIPVLILDPRPGEAVLDLCAAPGGKTTHIAAGMRNCGALIANEPSGRRQQALLANINRMGVVNATVTSYRGESFPAAGPFDRILVDAPCSAEGTLRKEPSLRRGASRATIVRLARMQQRLILRAFDLLRPGGILVYSTCTFAPEENESIVAHLLARRDARITRPKLAEWVSPGLTEWDGGAFPSDVGHCIRIYPHHFDSGGGFVARIERPV